MGIRHLKGGKKRCAIVQLHFMERTAQREGCVAGRGTEKTCYVTYICDTGRKKETDRQAEDSENGIKTKISGETNLGNRDETRRK